MLTMSKKCNNWIKDQSKILNNNMLRHAVIGNSSALVALTQFFRIIKLSEFIFICRFTPHITCISSYMYLSSKVIEN
jgi:hypothetical protein